MLCILTFSKRLWARELTGGTGGLRSCNKYFPDCSIPEEPQAVKLIAHIEFKNLKKCDNYKLRAFITAPIQNR